MKHVKPTIPPSLIAPLSCLIFYAASCSPAHSYQHPLEAEFQRHEITGRDLAQYARYIKPAERLLAVEEGVPDSALEASRKSIRLDSSSGTATVMFRFDPGEDSDDAHSYIYSVEVLPDLSRRFKGAVEFHPL